MAIELQDNTKIVNTPISYLDNRTEEQKMLDNKVEQQQKQDSAIKEELEKRQLLFDLSLPDNELQSKIENTTGFKFSPTQQVTYNGRTYNSYNELFKDLRGQGNKEFYWLYTVQPRDVPKSMSDSEFKDYLNNLTQLEVSLRKDNLDITSPVYQERFKIDAPAVYNGRAIPLSRASYYRDIDKKNAKFNSDVDNTLATLVFTPLLMYDAATAPLSFGVSLAGEEAIDGITNYFTNSDWSTFASKSLGINPQGEFAQTVMPWTNPGNFLRITSLKGLPKEYLVKPVRPKRSITPIKETSSTQSTKIAPYTLDPLWGKYVTARAFAREHPEYVKTYTVGSYVKDATDP